MTIKHQLLCALLSLVAGGACAETAVDRLKSLISATPSFQAEFKQVVRDEKGGDIQTSTGQVAVLRPGRFRWKSEPPYNQLLVSDGKELWRYDEDLEQVTVKKVDGRLGSTPALLLTGDVGSLDKVFVVEAKGADGFMLHPKDATGNMFESLEIEFKQGRISRMVMKDSLRQTTTIDYRATNGKQTIDASAFKFTPPAGVDVFRDEQ